MSGGSLAVKGLGFGGGSVSTKGLLGGGAEGAPIVVAPGPRLPPGLAVRSPTALQLLDADVLVIVPTAINLCLAVAENVTANLRARRTSDLQLPSLYKRAFLVAYETDEVALVHR